MELLESREVRGAKNPQKKVSCLGSVEGMASYQDLMEKNKAGILRFLKKYWLLLIVGILFVVAVIYYFKVWFHRVPKCMAKLDIFARYMSIHPMRSCKKLIENGYRLCDFYVASSYRPYLPCGQRHDYGSVEMAERVLRMGGRYLELDVYNRDFCALTDPVVCTGKQPGNWHYTSEINFVDICNMIANIAFSPSLSNSTDPLFLSLNLYVGDNTNTLDTMAKLLKDILGAWLLPETFQYQKTNIALTRMEELQGRVIVFASDRCVDSKLGQLINYTWQQPFMRSYSHVDVLDFHQPQEVTDYNRRNLTKVYPIFEGNGTQNYNPRLAWMYGCQFVEMNYGKPDDNMIIYWKKFKRSSFVLKPYKLRYHPTYYKTPTPQTKAVSFAPMQHSTPDYSITY